MERIALSVQDLTVAYERQVALWDVHFSLPMGKLLGVLGPNGAGKSTLLRTIMGLIPKRTGKIEIFGKSLEQARRAVAYVPQRESIDWDFPVSVYEVVLMGCYGRLGLFRKPSKEDKLRVEQALETVEMQAYKNRQVGQLSGGQQQRVFFARALVQHAELYLMDEPFAGVDARTEELIFSLLKNLAKQGHTLVIVFHNLYEVTKYFDWLLLLNKRLVGVGPIEKIFTEDHLKQAYGTTFPLLAEVMERFAKSSQENIVRTHTKK